MAAVDVDAFACGKCMGESLERHGDLPWGARQPEDHVSDLGDDGSRLAHDLENPSHLWHCIY